MNKSFLAQMYTRPTTRPTRDASLVGLITKIRAGKFTKNS